MEEQLVSLEVARLLKEKGFCNGSTHYYSNLNSKQELHKNDNGAVYIKGDYCLSYESALEEGLLMALRYL